MTNLENKRPKLLVVGDLMVDQYLWGSSDRISPEAPVPVINIDKRSKVLGGAGNVVNNLKSLGAEVDVISVIGRCKASNDLRELFNNIEINTDFLIQQDNRIVSKKSRIISSQQQVVRYDFESSDEISVLSQKKLLATFKKKFANYDLILLSDYGKGVLTSSVTSQIITLANSRKLKVLIDPKGIDFQKYKGAFLMTPNLKEASEATNLKIKNNDDLLKAIVKLKSDLNLKVSLVTMSEQGIAFFDNKLHINPTITKEVFDVTGAGDTVLASLGFALASDMKINDAVEFANLAAGVVVSKIGSATTTVQEIIDHKMSLSVTPSVSRIKNIKEISDICNNLRENKTDVVFTNGCFDIIHLGHIKYLEAAKNLGDVLVVGLNSDRSVKRIKGQTRPINSEYDRAIVLAALKVVDYVVIFDEDTPYELIKLIEPNTLVKGNDYQDKEIVGEDIVNKVVLVEFVSGKSTSKIIDKIKK